jgi:dTDP-4-dehydrorhamnose reductase
MKMPMYVIFGYEGVLGQAFLRKLGSVVSPYKIFLLGHGHVDVSNRSQVREVLQYLKPTVVLNCAGVSELEVCERAAAGAMTINAIGSKVVAEEGNEIGAKVVSFSSFHVFGGNRLSPYTERCKPSPINVLGKTKAEGERYACGGNGDHLVIRPGWLFDSGPGGVMSDWLEQMDRGVSVSVRPNRHVSPVFLPDLVDTTLDLLDWDAKGIFHVANSDAAVLENVAQTVCELVRTERDAVTSSRESQFLAPFPEYSVLSCKKCESVTRVQLRPWMSALKQCLFEMKRYKP